MPPASRWGTGPRHGSDSESAASAEARLIAYLANVRPHLRAGISVETIRASHNVSRKVAEYRLMLAQQRWNAE